MTFIEAVKIKDRICANAVKCSNCVLGKYDIICDMTEDVAIAIETILKNWNEEHPLITNHEMFVKTFGEEALKEINCEYQGDFYTWFKEEFNDPNNV